MRFHEAIGYHDYEVPTADVSERDRIASDLGPHYAMVMRNHGLIGCGRSIPDAFNLMYWLEVACQVQVDVMASGATPVMPTPELARKMAHRYSPDGPMQFSQMEWPALLRQLDREDPSFRQ